MPTFGIIKFFINQINMHRIIKFLKTTTSYNFLFIRSKEAELSQSKIVRRYCTDLYSCYLSLCIGPQVYSVSLMVYYIIYIILKSIRKARNHNPKSFLTWYRSLDNFFLSHNIFSSKPNKPRALYIRKDNNYTNLYNIS